MRGTTQFDWTVERVETLKRLWSDGLSASQIAAEMHCKSRSAVIGKVHRLNLATRDKKTSARKAAYVPRERKERAPAFRQPRIAQSAAIAMTNVRARQQRMEEAEQMRARFACEDVLMEGGKTILQLNSTTCRWPHGDPSNLDTFRYCGAQVEGEDRPYCASHARLAYKVPA